VGNPAVSEYQRSVKNAATDTLSALTESLGLFARTAPSWGLPVAVLGIVSALPEALLRYHARRLYAEFGGGAGVDLAGLQFLALGGLVILLFGVLVQIVGIASAFLVISEVAAGRPAGIAEGLRRTLAWRLQLSWLVSAFLVSTAHRLWFIGGCFLLLPFGFAVTDAYETSSGMAAIGRGSRLGFSRGPSGGRLGVPMAIASTVLLFGLAVLSAAVSGFSALLVPSVNLSGALEVAGRMVDPRLSGPDLLGSLILSLIPEPSIPSFVFTLIGGVWSILTQTVVFVVPVVAYHAAAAIDAAREHPILTGEPS
jgi:hypothetical protein